MRFVCIGDGCIRAHRCAHHRDQPNNQGADLFVNVEPNGCEFFSIPPADLSITPVDDQSDQQGFTPPA